MDETTKLLYAILNADLMERGFEAAADGLSEKVLAEAAGLTVYELRGRLEGRLRGGILSGNACLSSTDLQLITAFGLVPDEIGEVAGKARNLLLDSAKHRGPHHPVTYVEVAQSVGAPHNLIQYVLVFFRYLHGYIEELPERDNEQWVLRLGNGIRMLLANPVLGRNDILRMQTGKREQGELLHVKALRLLRKARAGEASPMTWKPPEPPLPTSAVLKAILGNTHRAATALSRPRREDRPPFVIEDEYDLQHLLRALLGLWFDDVRPEEPTPSSGTRSGRIDFVVPAERIAIEVKCLRNLEHAKNLHEDLERARSRYIAHPDVATLWFGIYDPEHFATEHIVALTKKFSGEFAEAGKRIDCHIVFSPSG